METVYRVNGIIFETEQEAQKYEDKHKKIQSEINENINKIRDIRNNLKYTIVQEYQELKLDFAKCRCDNYSDYSDKCLAHLCTCDILDKIYPDKIYDQYICQYHTNLYMRNKGCFHCRSTDCSKWSC